MWGINTTRDLVQIASKVLIAGIAFQQSDRDRSISLLKEDDAMEDKLNTMNRPIGFSQSGIIGSSEGESGAICRSLQQVYNEDREVWKKNAAEIWAEIAIQVLFFFSFRTGRELVEEGIDRRRRRSGNMLISTSNSLPV